MDVKYINPFIKAFDNVMPQLGFEVKKGGVALKDTIVGSGITITLGLIGDIKGNIIYIIGEEDGKKIASKMMMGMQVDELNEMAQSAISELTNMLTANASTNYSEDGIIVDISTPVLMTGESINIKVNSKSILDLDMIVDEMTIKLNVALE
ncbi:CheY-P phosphatase CheX [Andreesenia angusta]|uniref:CheY-P phosphatase CheX n=1 Tax=Andreesenia angusta TaxID=39480 RepID=A0A1S1VBM9_9FIRM|nr:chemotaxis protein CheX [Andreesenia angusta]OHW63229.1 CheY-P phosphatase CheX [Andreesenia angusta]